jgi:YD repeat-containing protein
LRHTSHPSFRRRRLSARDVRRLSVFALGCVAGLTSSADTTTYTYDVHGRLKVVRAPTGPDRTSTTHVYDAAGNRESVVVAFEDITPPNPPTGLSAAAQAFDLVRLTWTTSLDAGGGPVSYYKVYRGGSHVASPNAPPFDDWPLSASTTYSYRVSAVDPAGNESPQTAPVNTTTPPGPDFTPPSVPTNLQGSAASGSTINLSWGASTDNSGGSGLAGYEVFRNNGATPIGSPSGTSFSDNSATPATTYQYKVRAYDVAGNRSGFSNQISVTTPDTLAPSSPGAPTFSAITGGTATANWTAASDNLAVTGYRYSLNSGSSWTNVGNVLSANLTGLSLGTQYTMLVQAGDAAGNWGPSSSGGFTTASIYTDTSPFVGGFWANNNPIVTGAPSTSWTLSGGKTLAAFYSYYHFVCDWANCWYENYGVYLIVDGFNGNPGAQWLQSVREFTGASAVFGCSSSTRCWWFWPALADLSGSYTLTIVHQ